MREVLNPGNWKMKKGSEITRIGYSDTGKGKHSMPRSLVAYISK